MHHRVPVLGKGKAVILNRQEISRREMIPKQAIVHLRTKSSLTGVYTRLIDIHQIDRSRVSAQELRIPAVPTRQFQRRSEILVLDDRPDRALPLERHEFLGMGEIKTGSVS